MTEREALTALGLTIIATAEDIKRAFHKLAHIHHPDKGGDAEKFKKISHAYQILKDYVRPFGPIDDDWHDPNMPEPPITYHKKDQTQYYKPPAGPTPFGFTDANGTFHKTRFETATQSAAYQQAYREAFEKIQQQQREFNDRVREMKRRAGLDL